MNDKTKKLTIAIDGYASCGKSTFAKELAKRLNYIYIDSGAMYRVITLYSLQQGLIKNKTINKNSLLNSLKDIHISFQYEPKDQVFEVFLNGKNQTEEIRSIEVSNNVSPISKIKEVREKMVELQRDLGKNKQIVMDGRDIGTVVFPGADIKIFMTADTPIRAQRRYKELIEKGQDIDYNEIEKNIRERDFIDENREFSPLKKAKDAILLDNSHMTVKEQMEWIMDIINKKINED